ncbi:unnamed protein product [Adineta ricciae]|uniref:Uncharacterized protein n=1 Tax=Adineta ricciae TaxID=249248 RepID=A0A814MPM0_ADIRI|nr:unnamed protein product [Adineta ricciae]
MGALCSCGKGEQKPAPKHVQIKSFAATESNSNQSSTVIHSSEEILSDTLQTKIIRDINEYVSTIPSAYQNERERIVNEMNRSAPASYLGLTYSDYPDINGAKVNEMARRLVTSNEAKQQLIDRIDKQIDPIFISQTSTWTSLSRETARPVIRSFIEKKVNETFNSFRLE